MTPERKAQLEAELDELLGLPKPKSDGVVSRGPIPLDELIQPLLGKGWPPPKKRARPQLVAENGRLVWPGHDVEVIPSPGDPNWLPGRNAISIVRTS
jgi:hypothetical protein